jgi:SAM-dependent methyltransferase
LILADARCDEASVWQFVESCDYRADLGTWLELTEGAGPVLDLGCGIGRVARHLAAAGREVTGVDRDPAIIDDLNRLATEPGLTAYTGDVTEIGGMDLGRADFGAIIAPQQLLQIIGGPGARQRALAGVRRRLAPGGLAAFGFSEWGHIGSGEIEAVPDLREIGGWVFASRPVAFEDHGQALTIVRARQAVSPDGSLRESHDAVTLDRLDRDGLSAELDAAGLDAVRTIEVPQTERHVATVIMVARHAAGSP